MRQLAKLPAETLSARRQMLQLCSASLSNAYLSHAGCMIQSFLSPSLLAITFSNELHAFNNELQLLCVAVPSPSVPSSCSSVSIYLLPHLPPLAISRPCAKRADGPVMVL